jgi:hypothetical protein
MSERADETDAGDCIYSQAEPPLEVTLDKRSTAFQAREPSPDRFGKDSGGNELHPGNRLEALPLLGSRASGVFGCQGRYFPWCDQNPLTIELTTPNIPQSSDCGIDTTINGASAVFPQIATGIRVMGSRVQFAAQIQTGCF